MEQTTNPETQPPQEEEIKANPNEILSNLNDLPQNPEELQKK